MTKNCSPKSLIIYTDGGSRGNPGPAAIGAVLFDCDNNIVSEISRQIGIGTNNVAEYLAVVYALQEAVFIGADSITINVDSQLIARQLKGQYKVKDQNLKKFCDIALNLISKFDNVDINEIPREYNAHADKLVNRALDAGNLI